MSASLLVGAAHADGGSDAVNLHDFGATGEGTRDDAPALRQAYGSALARRRPLYLPAGRYRLESPIDWDVGAMARSGVVIYGDGPGLSVLDFVSDGPGPDLLVHCTAPDGAAFYSQLRDFSVRGHGGGPVLQLGRDDFADAHNGYSLERLVLNADGSGPALVLNGVYASSIDVVANAGGTARGMAMRLRQATFCRFSGAQGHASVGTWMGDGYNFGNVFTAIDYEVLNTGVVIAGANCAHNSWIGGTLANLEWGFDCMAGHDNIVSNINPGVGADRVVRHGSGLVFDPPVQPAAATQSPPPVNRSGINAGTSRSDRKQGHAGVNPHL